MAKRIYVKTVDFTVEEVNVLKELGYKFNSQEYLLLDGDKVKLDMLDNYKAMLVQAMPVNDYIELPAELLDDEEETQVIEDIDAGSHTAVLLEYVSQTDDEVGDNDGDFAEDIKENETNNKDKGGTTMLQEREITFDDLEVKALRNLGFKVTQEGIFFNDMEVNYEQKQKMKKELRIMTKYTKVYHSSDIDPSNFNKYSAFVWVSILRRESGISTKKLTDIIKGITMSQYIDIPSGKLIKLKEAIETSDLNADWKNRLVRSINAQ